MKGAGKWIAGGVVALGIAIGAAVLMLRKKPEPAPRTPPPPPEPPPVKTSIDPGFGAQTGADPTIHLGKTGFGGLLDLGLSVLGLNLGLSDLLSTPQVIADRIYFPSIYPTPEGDADLSKLRDSVSWPNAAFSVMADQDRAFAGFYQIWPAIRHAREWFGAHNLPWIMLSQAPSDFPETKATRARLHMGWGVRLSPAIMARQPQDARDNNLIWIPGSYPETGPQALTDPKDKEAARKRGSFVWDGVRLQWTPIPWENFGLAQSVHVPLAILTKLPEGADLHFANERRADTKSQQLYGARVKILQQTFAP